MGTYLYTEPQEPTPVATGEILVAEEGPNAVDTQEEIGAAMDP